MYKKCAKFQAQGTERGGGVWAPPEQWLVTELGNDNSRKKNAIE